MKHWIGWDIGGAHLKAVLLDEHARVLKVKLLYCPLWKGLDSLEQAIAQVLTEFSAESHAVTMTGELADIFSSREEGVARITQQLLKCLPGQVRIYAGKTGFIAHGQVERHWQDVASMNWLASAEYAGIFFDSGLFVDIGSTTTDITRLQNGRPDVSALTDRDRMQSDGLVYTGVIRTPLMALAHQIMLEGRPTHVAAEYFAITADIYRLTGELDASEYTAETPDGGDTSLCACARRLARIVGSDLSDASMAQWQTLAMAFKQAQITQIKVAMQHQIALVAPADAPLTLIGAGVGSFLVKQIADGLNCRYQHAAALIEAETPAVQKQAADCFPAFAVGALAIYGDDA